MTVDHEAVAKSILELIHNGASYQMIGNYLSHVYKEKEVNPSSWARAVDKQSGAFTQDEIDEATRWK